MRIIWIIYFGFFGILNVFGQFNAVYISEENLSKIKLDGDTADWNWVPSQYFITTPLMKDILAGKNVDERNWGCKIIVGWNDVKNWIYILAIVHDDVRNIDSIPGIFYLDDFMEIVVNADNLGGKYEYASDIRQKNTVKLHSCEHKTFMFKNDSKEPSWLCKKPNYMNWGYKAYFDNKKKTNVVVYEMGMRLWDKWSDKGTGLSKIHNLLPNQIIHLAISFSDVDKITDKIEAIWAVSSGKDYSWTADDLATFHLDYLLKNSISWDKIDNLIKP